MDEIKTITIKDKDYPKLLRGIKDAPKILYFRGELKNNEEKCFAVVGARICSPYGKEAALEIAGELAEAGLTIVSGLAPGIDTFAHLAALERKGRQIAVLGTGIDEESLYPRSNIELSRKIIAAGGCLVSEYPPGTSGTKFTFPRRNRIISGLSLGVLVVEAKQKSGALITADWAKKQGRKIFAVPGPIHSLNSKGPHFLIKSGAKLVENANDILRELNLGLSVSNTDRPTDKTIRGENEKEDLILEVLAKEESLDIDRIIEKTKLPASVTAGTIAILEIKGKVRNLGGNIYAVSNR